jgi:murein DD-endopeptidase MepM/ murein hydrolase activator NlpD
MKWLLLFLTGALCGAGALSLWQGSTPAERASAPCPAVALVAASAPAAAAVGPVVSVTATPAAIPAPAAVVPGPQAAASVTLAASADSMTAGLPLQPSASAIAVAPIAPPPVADAKPADKLLIPVVGINPGQLVDTFDQVRGKERRHEALDILAPKGTQVVAVADGKVVKLFNSKPGGLTVYQFDVTEKFAYYYAHLDHYASGVAEGTYLKRGDLVGYVGNTGNADPAAPHLHFAIFTLTPEKQWWKGTPLNPYPLLRE